MTLASFLGPHAGLIIVFAVWTVVILAAFTLGGAAKKGDEQYKRVRDMPRQSSGGWRFP